MTNKDLCKPEILQEITRLRALSTSYRDIREYLKEEYDVKATEQTIRKVYERVNRSGTQMVKSNDEMKSIINSEVLDTAEQLKEMNRRMRRLFDELKDKDTTNKVTDMVNVAREIRSQLEFQAKLLNKLSEQPKAQHINYIDQSIKVIKVVKSLEKEGYIEILKDLPNHEGD